MLSTITREVKPTRPEVGPQAAAAPGLPPEVTTLAAVLKEEFDATFRFHDAATGSPVGEPGPADGSTSMAGAVGAAARELAAESRPRVIPMPGGEQYLIGFPMAEFGLSPLVAIGVVPGLARSPAGVAQERARLERWARSVHDRLVGSMGDRDRRRGQDELDRQSMIAWEALMSLERLHRGVKIHRESTRERLRVLRAIGEFVGAQALVWVPTQGDEEVAIEGDRLVSPWDCGQLANILASRGQWEESGYVLINETRETEWGARFPRVVNLLAVPVAERKLNGWVLALNKRRTASRGPAGRDARPAREDAAGSGGSILPFRRSDAALMLPFASMIGMQLRGSRRYLYIKDLLVGLTRALTSAIDAKDAYTYGHSERVARAAVELGRELGLPEDELSDIYLAGLLHDIGKIGIRDEVLTKKGPLTEEEFQHIQQHVIIGHRILAGLHAIEHLLPGVLYHHESFDGKGYPERLKGESIPLLARILAVADSFDAMSTSRPYRTAMPPDRVDQILRQGSGTQWDPLVIEAYVRCRDRLKSVRERGIGESLRDALDGAMRHGQQGNEFASMEMSVPDVPRRPASGLS